MRRLLCFFGRHRYELAYYSYTCEQYVCRCGKAIFVFSCDPLALSEIVQLNALWKRSERNTVGR